MSKPPEVGVTFSSERARPLRTPAREGASAPSLRCGDGSTNLSRIITLDGILREVFVGVREAILRFMADPKAPARDLPAPSDVQQVSAASGVSLAGLRDFGKLVSGTYTTFAAHVQRVAR